MDILKILEELEDKIIDSPKIPLTGKVLMDEEQLLMYIDKIRSILPDEISKAKGVLESRENLLAKAKIEAEEILEKAKQQGEKWLSESEMLKIAEERAREIIAKANSTALELKQGARQYAVEVLEKLAFNLNAALQEVTKGLEELKK
ncbi:hypothetical protein [Carboxydothermus ferrireducens]|uniref:ATPase n=1 Tax=Carboxydothermus ferrireducens DSM 11255 TaxID=1119529 RepID=A0ABX2RDV4_9THEO|nr:hypothetical protein [Carboxydothermus ferrireducens]NYE58228.1 hypothetical protein [Carboxydothermus ferrireducens DSM 11255]